MIKTKPNGFSVDDLQVGQLWSVRETQVDEWREVVRVLAVTNRWVMLELMWSNTRLFPHRVDRGKCTAPSFSKIHRFAVRLIERREWELLG